MFVALKDILTQIHAFHLEAETFSAHKISDALRAAVDPLVDKYMEVTLAGKRRRIEFGEGFKPVHMSKLEFYEFLDETLKLYKKMRERATPDVQTIVDEMVVETKRAIYLLDFE